MYLMVEDGIYPYVFPQKFNILRINLSHGINSVWKLSVS